MNDDDRLADPIPEIQALPRTTDPPPRLEDRVVAALHAHGVLTGRHTRARRWWAAAAAVTLFVAGMATSRAVDNRPAPRVEAPAGPMFALLLYDDARLDAGDPASLTDEYRRWAASLRQNGRIVTGERLDDAVRTVGASSLPPVEPIGGFFLISAESLDDALDVARSCPHVRYGGRIVVRPIAPA